MKVGYKRLLIFSCFLIFILTINTFFINILSNYRMIFFMFMLLVVFNYYFVLEKDNDRYFKDILFEIFIFTMMFFIVYYSLGLLTGLAKTPNYLSFSGIKNVLLPIILFCILREIFRYNMIKKSDGSIICTIVVVIMMILFDICDDYYFMKFNSQYAVLKFVALILLPYISSNISYSYITKRFGYKVVIVFDLIFSLYRYILPIIPNPSEYLVAIITLLIPVFFAFRLRRFYKRRKDEVVKSDYRKRRIKGIILPTILIAAMVYFYSGYFRYYAIAIASGSMTPKILKGDVVVVDQHYNYKELEIGDVIAYRYNQVIIVHRIAKKIEIGDSYIYYTKGDANSNMDDFVIKEDVFIGKVEVKIPKIGYPTVWFNKE